MSPAEQLLQELGVTDPHEIDLEPIAWHCGARVVYRPLVGCEAQIIGYGANAVIVVDERGHPKRKRFSIAHELGHWHHHRGQSSVCRTTDIEDYSDQGFADERTANKYASDLLLPTYLFGPRARALKEITIDAAAKVAEEFNTSLTAVAMRLLDLRRELSVLVCHSTAGRKWFKRAQNVPECWFPRRELDPRSKAMDVLFGTETKSRRSIVNASFWFCGRDAQKVDVFEEIVRVSSSEVLAVLVFKELPGR